MKNHFLIIALLLSLLVAVPASAWTVPTDNPPSGNAEAPLNTSTGPQTKFGGLTVGSPGTGLLKAAYKFFVGTTPSGAFGTTADYVAEFEGKIGASQICGLNGTGCLPLPLVVSGGGGGGGGDSLWATSTLNANNIYNKNTGNVGVGTTNPVNLFQVGDGTVTYPDYPKFKVDSSGNATAYGNIRAYTGRGYFQNMQIGTGLGNSSVSGSLGGVINFQNAASESFTFQSVLNTSNANVFTFNARPSGTGNLLQVQKSGTASLTLDTNGNLGLGAITPTKTLTLPNTGTYQNYWDAVTGYLLTGGRVQSKVFYDYDDTNYFLDPSNTGTAFRIAGNAGIGTSGTPPTRLQVVGASILANNTAIDPDMYLNTSVAGTVADGSGWSVQGVGGNGGANGRSWGIGNSGGVTYFGSQNGSAANTMQTFMQSNPNRDLILTPTSGNVGVGTAIPAAKLDVTGNLKLTGDAYMSGRVDVIGNLVGSGDITTSGKITSGTTVYINSPLANPDGIRVGVSPNYVDIDPGNTISVNAAGVIQGSNVCNAAGACFSNVVRDAALQAGASCAAGWTSAGSFFAANSSGGPTTQQINLCVKDGY